MRAVCLACLEGFHTLSDEKREINYDIVPKNLIDNFQSRAKGFLALCHQ